MLVDHQIGIQEFLVLSEKDLIEIGIDKIGIRKKILEAIADIHKRDWEKSSLPQITPRDKSKGIYLSVIDATSIMANISSHTKYINSNITFINKQIKEKPELLKLGTDAATVKLLGTFSRNAHENMKICNQSLVNLRATLNKYENINEYQNADLVEKPYRNKYSNFKTLIFVASPLIIFGIGIYYRS